MSPRPEAEAAATGRDGGVDLLRAVAILLIVNSHLDAFYPEPRFATGGALGNALFFCLSGYGLGGPGRRADCGFARWYLRRVCRIYPALTIAVLLLAVLPGGDWRSWAPGDLVAAFVWPTPYWFVAALMLFYAALYPLRGLGRPAAYLALAAALWIPYLGWYFTGLDLSRYTIEGEGHFKWIHYFQVLLFGAWLAARRPRLDDGGWRDGALLAAALLGYYGILALVAGGRAGRLQGLTHLLVYPILYAALRLARSRWSAARLLGRPWARAAAALIAGLTLEIYLVQGAARAYAWALAPGSPAALLVFAALLAAAAWLLQRAARLVARLAGCAP